MTFMAFHPEEVARQLTLIEHELFTAIKPWECIGQSWAKQQHKAGNILNMINRFNKVSIISYYWQYIYIHTPILILLLIH